MHALFYHTYSPPCTWKYESVNTFINHNIHSCTHHLIIFSAVPGVPQRISAAEISQPRDNLCIILVSWDPPANSGASDVDQYIVYVPSRNIEMTVQSSSSPLTTLTVMNCGDDVRIQVAAMNRFGCGMNSSEVQPILLDDNIVPNATVTVTTGGASPSSKYF